MNREEALVLLNASEDTWEEDIDQIVFDYKKFIFQNNIIPKLYNAKIKRLSLINEAVGVLKGGDELNVIEPHIHANHPINNLVDLIDFYRDYEQTISKLKGEVNKANSVSNLIEGMVSLKNREEDRMNDLYPLAEILQLSPDSVKEIKISDWISTGKVLSEIKELKEDGESILTKEIIESTSYLQSDLKRIIKYKLANR